MLRNVSARSIVRALACLLLAGLPLAAPAEFDPSRAYRQSPGVRARYPDPAVLPDTPGFRPGRQDFTSHAEMMAYVRELERAGDNVQVRIIGYSGEGRAIPLLVLSSPSYVAPADVLKLDRPVVFLQGLQHGNEPAGGEAMLAVARELSRGRLRPLLDRITVVIAPRCNPDGAHHFTRSPPAGIDVNRDHVKVDLPETLALHRAIVEYQPDVFVDAHEFSVATRWIEKFRAIQSYDMTWLYSTNPNVAPELTRAAHDWFRPRLVADLERAGYSHFWYFTTSYDMTDRKVSMGGLSPDIGRNTAGLGNAISFLVESRGVGIGREGYGRRVASHLAALESLLSVAAERSRELLALTRDLRRQAVERGRAPREDDRIVVTQRPRTTTMPLRMLDPDTGAERVIDVDWDDTLAPEVRLARARPRAYLMPPSYHDVARRLAASGVVVRRLAQPVTLAVEGYDVTAKRVAPQNAEGRVRVTVTTTTRRLERRFDAGSYVYSMAQPNAALLAVALEPESSSSFVTFGIVPVDAPGTQASGGSRAEVPIYRLLEPAALEASIVEPAVADTTWMRSP